MTRKKPADLLRTAAQGERAEQERRVMEKQLTLTIDEVAAAFERGDLYFIESDGACHYYGRFRKLSVISKPAGGECRGYMSIEGGPWLPSSPCYTGEWPEMDREVERRRGITIAAYRVAAGGERFRVMR